MIVTFGWNPNPVGDNVTSYNLYAGRSSGVYTDANSPKNVGDVTTGSYDIGGNYGLWFFALTALNVLGRESGFSSELSGFFVTGVPQGSLVSQRVVYGLAGASEDGETPTPVFMGPHHMQVTHPHPFDLSEARVFHPEGAILDHGGNLYQRLAGRWILIQLPEAN